ncbi:uncharacterized protein [Acropora muricata]|uniref:uncharacterized protein isoform X2 n=1 Tax=Acropora muricata TaxID=159855 RepID=UPI0034E6055B
MKLMARKQIIRNILLTSCIISACCGLTSIRFDCSLYTFHDPQYSTWEESRRLCNSSGSDLVSIEEFQEWQFLNNTLQTFGTVKYYIGLTKDKRTGLWSWLSNGKSVNATTGKFPWAGGEPYGGDGANCATMYKDYRNNYGLFDDLQCFRGYINAGYICEMAVACMNEVPTSFNVTPRTARSVRASWKFTSWDSLPLGVVIRGFKLLYRLRNSSNLFGTAIVWGNSTFCKNISGLEKYAEYEFKVLAFTANGDGPSSSVLVVRTDEDVPSQAPVNLSVASKTSTSIMASWKPPPKDSRNGIIIGFKLFHKRKGSAESEKTVVVKGGTTVRKSITGLLKYTEYEVQVLAYTAVGDGPKTHIRTVRTFSVPTIEEDVSPPFVVCEMGTLCLLFCYATSDYPRTMMYSWTKNGISLTDGDTFKIMNTSVVIRPHRMEDYGVYACKASNGIHTTTYNITLGVKLNSSAVVARRAENESHDSRFVITVTAFSTVIMLLLIPIGLLLWQRRKMPRQNTNVSEDLHIHSQSRALMSLGSETELAYMELEAQGGSLKHVYQTLQGKAENIEYYNVQLNKDNVVQDTGDYEIAATF